MAQLGRIWADGIWNVAAWNVDVWAQVGSSPVLTGSYLVMQSGQISPGDAMYVANDLLFSCTLTDDTGALVASGAVSLTVKDSSGAEVAGVTWPLELSHSGAGRWSAVIDAAMQLEYGKTYVVELSASSGELDGFWKKSYTAAFRGFE